MRTALILNPTAGASLFARQSIPEEEHEKALLQALHTCGIQPEIFYTTPEDPGRELATQLVAEGLERIIAVGGDGTIHAVAHGLIGSKCVLGIIPAGTMNNLAYCLGIPTELEAACAILAEGETRSIDVGMVNQHPFLEVAGVGLEAALFPAAEEVKSRGLLSTITGVINGLSTLFNFHPPYAQVVFDNKRPRLYRATQITICNTPYYGAHMNVAPGIVMNDGWLDVVLYTNFSKREFLQHAISISQGRRTFTPKIIYRRARSLRISTSEAVEVQADGVVYGNTPVEITLQADALTVQVPRGAVPGLLPEDQQQTTRTSKRRRRIHV